MNWTVFVFGMIVAAALLILALFVVQKLSFFKSQKAAE